ncbi:MAG: DSD1 family PLP-dependent enzyme [Hyphomicrobiales bacterium]|nr:MAG: DSD1 family PLP-dependent enzyme [Hyphomicrobiales bacterium]
MQPAPAAPGQALAEVDTPALIVDLDAYERNLDRMAEFARVAGVRIRPHAKTHKSPVIAAQQVARGAVGVCCQKVSEAEVLVRGGIADVLVSNEVVGATKLARLAKLAHRARISVCVDAPEAVAEIEAAAAAENVRINVLVEIDVGGRRCGVPAGAEAARLAGMIANRKHLAFEGLQAYHGSAQHLRTLDERRAAIAKAVEAVRETQAELAKLGLEARTIAGAGTGTYEIETGSGVYNELQPGSYVFMDADYARNRKGDGTPFDTFEHALFVLATVMSASAPERRVVDAGHKVLPVDSGMPLVWQIPGAIYGRPSDEHGVLDVTACPKPPARGDKVLLVPAHCDPTVNLHDWYVGIRGLGTPSAKVESVWPVAARGAAF